MNYNEYTEEELINFLKQYYEVYNKIPTTRDLKNNKEYPTAQTFANKFGNHKNALIKAGLYDKATNKIMFERHSFSDKELLNMMDIYIKKFMVINNRLPRSNEISLESDMPNVTTLINRFGGIYDIYVILGYELDNETYIKVKATGNKTNKDLLNEFIDVVKNKGKIGAREFSKNGLCSMKTYFSRFKITSYSELLFLDGFEEYADEMRIVDNEEVIAIYKEIKQSLKHVPTLDEIDLHTRDNSLPSITSKIWWRWGGYSSFLSELGDLSANTLRQYYSIDGSRCLSMYERIISDTLYLNDIEYIKEVPYKTFIPNFKKTYRVDFYLVKEDIYIEAFCMEGIEKYDIKTKEKQNLFKQNGLKSISIFPHDFKINNYKMLDFLKERIDSLDELHNAKISV